MKIELAELSANKVYHLMTQVVIPRPIAWVLSENEDLSYNLAPFSYFTPIASDPPSILFSVGKKQNGDIKDTARNLEVGKKFTLHIASSDLAEALTESSRELEYGASELSNLDLTLEFESDWSLPRIEKAPVAFEATVAEVIEVGAVPQKLIIAHLSKVYISDEVASETEGRVLVDALSLDPLARLGGGEYAQLSNVFKVERPKS